MNDGDRRAGGFGSIRVRLALWFVALAVIPAAIVLWLAREVTGSAVERGELARLATIARDRASRLDRFAEESIRSLDAIAEAPGMIRAASGFAQAFDERGERFGPGYEQVERRYGAFLRSYADAYELPDLLLIGLDRRILYSLARPEIVGQRLDEAPWRGGALARSVERVAQRLEPEIASSERATSGRPSSLWAVGPVVEGAMPVGFVAKEFDRRELDAVISDRRGLGGTGETIVAARLEGAADRLLVTGPLADDPQAGLRVEIGTVGDAGRELMSAFAAGEGLGAALGRRGQRVLAAWTYVPNFDWALVVSIDEDEAFAVLADIRDRGAWTVVALLAVAVALALLVARRFALPIRAASDAASRIAAGDLSRPVEVRGTGELRDLLERMRATNDDLAALVAKVQWSAGRILATSGRVGEIARTQREVASGYASSTTEIAAATNQMNATARELQATVVELERTARRAGASAETGRGSLERIGGGMERLERGASEVSGRLAEIRDRAAAVDEAVGVIARVANRTNLLAVNAAIEAEKAGSHGRGFQVVAAEIDRLANETASSALEIESIVAAMRSAVGHGVREIDGFAKVVGEACETAHAAGEGVGSVLRQVEELQASFVQVAKAVEGQSEGIAQVHAAMTQLVEGARKTSASADEGLRAGEELASAAKGLEGDVSSFRLG